MSPKLVLLAWQTFETQFWNFYTTVDIVRFFCPPRRYPIIEQKVLNTDMLLKIFKQKTYNPGRAYLRHRISQPCLAELFEYLKVFWVEVCSNL